MDKDIRQYLHYYLGKARVRHRYVDYEQGVWTVWEKLTIDHYDRLLNDFSIDGIEIELRKLESMTEQEAQELLKVRFNHPWQNPIYERHSSLCIDFKFSSGPGEFSKSQLDWDMLNAESFHYLLSHGFDLFSLIESGAAINKEQQ